MTGVSPAVDALASAFGHAEMLETHHRLTPTLNKGYSAGGLWLQGGDRADTSHYFRWHRENRYLGD